MTAEMNKGEALRCIEIAERAFSEGNLAKAEKFLSKAERLCPTNKAKGKRKISSDIFEI